MHVRECLAPDDNYFQQLTSTMPDLKPKLNRIDYSTFSRFKSNVA